MSNLIKLKEEDMWRIIGKMMKIMNTDDSHEYYCNICDYKIIDKKNCNHWPGKVYQVDNKNIMCMGTKKNKHEVSEC